MSYDTEKAKQGSQPLTAIGIVADKCANDYGVSPCTAGQGATGNVVRALADRAHIDAAITTETTGAATSIVRGIGDKVYMASAQSTETTGSVVRAMHDRVYLDADVAAVGDTLVIDSGTGAGEGSRTVDDYVVDSVTNVIDYSEDFNNAAWVKTAISIGSSSTAPDGTSNALALVPTAVNTSHDISDFINFSASSTITFSIYAKAGNADYLSISITSQAFVYANFIFDLVTVAAKLNARQGSYYSNETASIESIGSGWYRCSCTLDVTLYTSADIKISPSYTYSPTITNGTGGEFSFTGSGLDDVFIFGAQAEESSAASEYVPTSGSSSTETVRVAHVDSNYNIPADNTSTYILTTPSNAALINQTFVVDSGTGAGEGSRNVDGYKIESVKNHLVQSEDMTAGDYVAQQVTVTANAAVAPDGNTTMDAIYETVDTATHRIYNNTGRNNSGVTIGHEYTYSCYLKANGRTLVATGGDLINNSIGGLEIDLSAGTILSQSTKITSSSITDMGNGVYKVTATAVATAANGAAYLILRDDLGNSNYTGDTTKGVYWWGVQISPTNTTEYVPTTTAQATETLRLLDLDSRYVTPPDATSTYITTTPADAVGETLAIIAGTGSGQNVVIDDYVVESVTNKFLYSEQFDNAAWAKASVTIGADVEVDPFGGSGADKMTPSAATAIHNVYQSIAIESTTVSVFAKADGYSLLGFHGLGLGSKGVVFDLSSGTYQNNGTWSSASITDAGGGWYLCSAAGVAAGSSIINISVTDTLSNASASWLANGIDGVLVFGAHWNAQSSQLEYVPTTTTAATELIRAPHITPDFTTIPDATSDYALIDRTNACFNTRITCQDVANYSKTTEEIIFCEPRSNLPQGVKMFPFLDGDVEKAPTSTTGGSGLGNRATVTATIKDFPHNDRGIDPYIDSRSYTATAEQRGTFFSKWFARNPYYEGRTLKVYRGFIGSPFSWSDFQVEEYDIYSADGPTNGKVTFLAKDILVRTYKEKAQYPVLSSGVLSSDIAASASTATLSPTGIGNSEYPASGHVSIGKEVKAFTRSGDILTFTAHGEYGTEDVAHNADDAVQLCVTWTDTNVVDVLDELLTTGAGLPSSYIPYGTGSQNWDDEKDEWLSSSNVSGILMKPESIEKVLGELSTQFMFDIWWDGVDQEVKIKALSPEPSGVTIDTLTEDYEILEKSLKVKRDTKRRISQVQVWYDKIDYSEKDEPEQFAKAYISADTSTPSADKYGSESIKVINARWITTESQASKLAGRTLARFADTPEMISFEVRPKDDGRFEQAGRVAVQSWQFSDFTGLAEARNFQVTKIQEIRHGDRIKVEALTSSFSGRYAFIGPAGLPDYSSATDDQKARYSWIAPASGVFADGSQAYKII